MSVEGTAAVDRPPAGVSASRRDTALDVARGMAVLGMVYVHLVSSEGASVGAIIARALEGRPAALFCVLAGMAWSMHTHRAGHLPGFTRYVVLRASALLLAGLAMHVLIWPTEILVPFALMMPLAILVARLGPRATMGIGVLLLALAPLSVALFGSYVDSDWTTSGSHATDTTLGWATVRYLLFDGNYPLIPWLVFPLVGHLMVRQDRTHTTAWFWSAMVVAVFTQAWVQWASVNADALGWLAPYVTSTWVPTSVPFVLVTGSSAVVVISGMRWLIASLDAHDLITPLARFGRASLTHYVLHICLVFVPLRWLFPEEDWPVSIGLLAWAGYVAIALPLTTLWFRRWARGPIEGAWARISGPL